MEYVIILGLVSLVLTGMNMYIKRGVQARLKDMTDYFVGKDQSSETSPNTTTLSEANNLAASNTDLQNFTGGGRLTNSANITMTEAASTTVDSDTPFVSNAFVSAQSGYIAPPAGETPQGNTQGEGGNDVKQ